MSESERDVPSDARDTSPDRVVLDAGTRLWSDGRFCTGGAPWRLTRLSPTASDFLRQVHAAGPLGLAPVGADRPALSVLVERGLVHPLRTPREGPHDVRVVVPVHGRPEALGRCLERLAGLDVVVVDDASPGARSIESLAALHGATYVRLPVNRGPAAARNAGAAASSTELVAFVDADCEPRPGWLDALVPHFDDPRVGVVAPRIVPVEGPAGVLARYEATDSALDMGDRPALVRPGAALGYVPSATLLVRAAALPDGGFDEELRLGEDVDLAWRIADAGWLVRYDPSVLVEHELRDSWSAWAGRRFDYGTSAAPLEHRHPGRLTPVRVSGWNIAAFALVALGRRRTGAALLTAVGVHQVVQLRESDVPLGVAASLAARSALGDAESIGRVLRREYWPIGAAALALSPWSRPARAVSVLMLAPVARDWVRGRRALDPGRYTLLRLAADAAYGSGVQAAAVRGRAVGPLRPRSRSRRAPASGVVQLFRRLRGAVT